LSEPLKNLRDTLKDVLDIEQLRKMIDTLNEANGNIETIKNQSYDYIESLDDEEVNKEGGFFNSRIEYKTKKKEIKKDIKRSDVIEFEQKDND